MDPQIQCSDLYERLGDEELLVVDCRSSEDWRTLPEHIPGALRLEVGELADAVDALPEDELIVLCGCSPDGADIRRALHLLRLKGRAAVCLGGGLLAWRAQGYPIERHEHPAAAATPG